MLPFAPKSEIDVRKSLVKAKYLDIESRPGLPHSYQTWQSSGQVQMQKKPTDKEIIGQHNKIICKELYYMNK